MRSLIQKDFLLNPPKNPFTMEDIKNCILYAQPPRVTIYPFRNFCHPKKHTPIQIKVSLVDPNNVDFTSIFPEHFFKVPLIVFETGVKLFKDVHDLWMTFFSQNVQKFAESFESKLFWNLVKVTNVLEPKTLERSIWVYFNFLIDTKEQREFIEDVRDSIVSFINPNLYLKIKESIENKRINIDYERQRRELEERVWLMKPEQPQ